MAAEQGSTRKIGPDERGNHAGSTVVKTPESHLWVSTAELSWTPGVFETFVFPIPNGVELMRNAEGRLVFSEDFPLREVGPNTTNIRGISAARRVHRETVQHVVRAVGGGGTR